MSGRPIGGTWRAAALAAAVASPPWVPWPFQGGCGAAASLAGLWSSAGRGGGEGGGGEGEWRFPAVPPWSPGVAPWRLRGGGRVFPVPGSGCRRGECTLPPPPFTLWVPDPRAGFRSGPLLSLPGGGGGAVSAGGGGSGQRSAVSGLRGSGPLPALVARPLPYWRWCAPHRRVVRWGGAGARAPLALIAWSGGARPLPASSLAWGLGLRQRRVPPVVAPVGEVVAQGPGEPVVGIASVMRSTAPPSKKAGHVGSLLGHAAQISARRTLY